MPHVPGSRSRLAWIVTGAALFAASLVARAAQQPPVVEREVRSKYSRIKVTRQEMTRTLWFVRDNGEEVVESSVDLERPDDLLVPYTRFMFLSYVFRPNPGRVLIVGLGGGAMVHFLQRHDPKVKVDVVEIDPEIVGIADRYFGVRTERNVHINVTDGLEYLQTSDARYDVIYMDAFLRPSGGTDAVGVPLHLKTLAFYGEVRKRLNPDGLVVFNVNPHAKVAKDIRAVEESFPNTYVFPLGGNEGYVVVASTAKEKLSPRTIRDEAARLDRRFKAPFSFKAMAARFSDDPRRRAR